MGKIDDGMHKGKGSGEQVSARRLKILELICNEPKGISLSSLVNNIAAKYNVQQNTIQDDLKSLKEKFPIEINMDNICVSRMGLEKIWSDTEIGNRMGKSESKRKLAQRTYSFIMEHKDNIGTLVLGAGTTVHECAKELINHEAELPKMRFDTDNLLVLYEFICNKSNKLHLELPQGLLDWDRAALKGRGPVKYFQNLAADVVITSFSDMSFKQGFCTIDEDSDKKLTNLHSDCRWIIIPIEWDKIGTSIGTPIAENIKKQLDFKKKYVIITNIPVGQERDSEVNKKKLEDLNKWKNAYPDIIEIIDANE